MTAIASICGAAGDGAVGLTLVRNREGHLRQLVEGLRRSSRLPDELVVVDMSDRPATVGDTPFPIHVDRFSTTGLPLAEARNRAARLARHRHLVFLDVDCIPLSRCIGRLEEALSASDALFCADIRYLGADDAREEWQEADLLASGARHPVRDFPSRGMRREPNPGLFWSLAFAIRAATFEALRGFDEGFCGYGAEDTDFGFRADAAGLPLMFVGGAIACHQHHESFDPPVQHVTDIVANARWFRARWGSWPMEGWLKAFAAMGIVHWTADHLELLRMPTPEECAAAPLDRSGGEDAIRQEGSSTTCNRWFRMRSMELFLQNRIIAQLSEEERASLERAVSEHRRLPARATLLERGDTLRHSTMLITGFMIRYIDDLEGRRQVVAFHVPGDFVDLHGYPLEKLDHSIATLTEVEIANVPHSALRLLTDGNAEFARKLWASTLLDAAMHREWLFRLGRLDAGGRVAHFLAETNARLGAIGLSDGSGYDLPITQTDLSEITGLTSIHVNRVLRMMREERICTFRSSRVEISDLKRLERIGQFDPTYLYLETDVPGAQAAAMETAHG